MARTQTHIYTQKATACKRKHTVIYEICRDIRRKELFSRNKCEKYVFAVIIIWYTTHEAFVNMLFHATCRFLSVSKTVKGVVMSSVMCAKHASEQ